MSIEEAERRPGRKRQRLLGDGDKRHGRRDLDARLLVAGGYPGERTRGQCQRRARNGLGGATVHAAGIVY
jgi:hypothetical protein